MTALGIDVGGSSVKLAALQGDQVLWISQSATYQNPTRAQLTAAIQSAIKEKLSPASVGICVPGVRERASHIVKYSVNIPALNGLDLDQLIADAVGRSAHVVVATDAVANGYDIYATNHLRGRLVALALGTGVGMAVLDDGLPLMVDGESPGHIGQVDCSIAGDVPIGPDGGAGSLEAYIGVPALVKKYNVDIPTILDRLGRGDSAVKALARAIRIIHGIYCPDHIALTGGLGIRMGHLLPVMRELVDQNLTKIARPGWTLLTGQDDYHAARGVGRMAAKG